jgi:hypothetical protein
MDGSMKKLSLIIVLIVAGSVSAQVSFSAGSSTIKGFGVPKWFTGFHLGVEVPRDDAMSFYGKYTHQFARGGEEIFGVAVANEVTTTPYTINVAGVPTMNYHILEGGTRYYLGDGFDFGFAGYGGTNFMLIFNKTTARYDDLDETLYTLDPSTARDGGIISLGMGLTGGAKYTFPRLGTFYADISASYLFLGQMSNSTTYIDLYSKVLFGLNVGYRKDLFW